MTSTSLLRSARRFYDQHVDTLEGLAHQSIMSGFGGGAQWMMLVLSTIRGNPLGTDPDRAYFNALGTLKYGTCTVLAALSAGVAAELLSPCAGIALFPILFYFFEGHLVFAFPLALDGSKRPFRDSFELVRQWSSSSRAMMTTMGIAFEMLSGGFRGHGFVRSWCTGCVAVVMWYERVRGAGGGHEDHKD